MNHFIRWWRYYYLEITAFFGLASLCYGASMIYTPLPYLIVGLILCALSIMAARKGG